MIVPCDQKFVLTDGKNKVMENLGIGAVSILDFSVFPPLEKQISDLPCSVIGPPFSVAITPDEKIAIITSAMKVDPNNPSSQIPDNKLNVIDIEKNKVIQTLVVGNQPTGISIDSSGKFALLCNRADGTISSLSIYNKEVKIAKTLKVCEPNENLCHVAISPDGSFALASMNKSDSILKIFLKDGFPQSHNQCIKSDKGPYGMEFTPDGHFAVIANITSNNVTILRIDNNKTEIIQTLELDSLPEGIDISSDGKWLTVCCMNNSSIKPDDMNRRQFGEVVLYKKERERFIKLQSLLIDRIPQSAIFSPDMKYIVVAGYENKRLTFYMFQDGKIENKGVIMNMPGQPCALRIAK
jgi:DNA-binding beta-propeller fold protein YncE